ncbi:DNA replication and repair protein RadC [bacterium A37T11]|nr:DNA replication and repair protein RadC [bacterium A37T11]
MENTYQKNMSIKSWAEDDRPREKLLKQGRRSLTDAELIAILIGSGSRTESAVELGRRMLHAVDNNLNLLAKLSVPELCKFKGIGEAKAISIVAALELGRRRKEAPEEDRPVIHSSKDVYQLLKPMYADLNHEEFWILLVNNANKVLNKQLISRGGTGGTVVDVKIVFQLVIQHGATTVVLTHNHPSGSLRPSPEDVSITKRISQAGALLDIRVMDHVIFTDKGYYSFADAGQL